MVSSVCEDLASRRLEAKARNGRPERRRGNGLRKNEVYRGTLTSLYSGCLAPARDEAHRERRVGRLDGTGDLPAREPWHPEIGKDQISARPIAEASETLGPIRSLNHLVTLSTQQVGNHLPDRGIILDEEDPERRHHRLSGVSRRICRLGARDSKPECHR